jgi:hypothetical protein
MRRSNVLAGEATSPLRPVIAGERCDRCCAPACVSVVLASGLDLAFCGHHARQYELALRGSGSTLRWDRHGGP